MGKSIYIVGCPRSGTKFLANTLNSHSDIWITGELNFFKSIVHESVIGNTKHLYPFKSKEEVDNLFEILEEKFQERDYWQVEYINFEKLKNRFAATNRSYKALYTLLMQERAEAHGKSIYGEKTPSNLYQLEKLTDWFPKGKVLHIIRDPRAVFVSQINKKNKPNYPLQKDNPLYKLGIFFYVWTGWLQAIFIHAGAKRKHPENYKLVKYNDLLSNREGCIKEICQFLDVKYESTMLNCRKTDSSFKERDPNYDPISGWKKYIPRSYKTAFEVSFGKLIERFCY
ncbi:MAG: sulfotransferase [Cyclobacteriaceae bacterium]